MNQPKHIKEKSLGRASPITSTIILSLIYNYYFYSCCFILFVLLGSLLLKQLNEVYKITQSLQLSGKFKIILQ